MKHPQESQPESRLDRAVLSVRQDTAPPIDPQLDIQINAQARLEAESDSQQETKWRFPMRQFTRAAIAAAVVVLVVFGGFSLFPKEFDSRAAIAMAIEQVRAISVMEFITTMEVPGQDQTFKVKTIVANSGLMRQEMSEPTPTVTIIDFKKGRIISLVVEAKQAQIIDMSGLPEDKMPKDVVAEFSNLDPEHTTYLRDEQRNGSTTHLYEMDNGPISGLVWIDADTKLPVRMEITMSVLKDRTSPTVVLDQFKWDVQVDESMFSMEIPEGYQTRHVDMSHPTEADWILMLRLWAALTQEPFPDEMGPKNLSAVGQLMHDPSLSPEENFRRLVVHVGPLLGEDAFTTKENAMQSLIQLGEALGRGSMFVMTLEQTEWRWVGGGVSAGEADKPLCWWKLKDTEKYRVLYGDFTVRDVEQDNLPVIP